MDENVIVPIVPRIMKIGARNCTKILIALYKV